MKATNSEVKSRASIQKNMLLKSIQYGCHLIILISECFSGQLGGRGVKKISER